MWSFFHRYTTGSLFRKLVLNSLCFTDSNRAYYHRFCLHFVCEIHSYFVLILNVLLWWSLGLLWDGQQGSFWVCNTSLKIPDFKDGPQQPYLFHSLSPKSSSFTSSQAWPFQASIAHLHLAQSIPQHLASGIHEQCKLFHSLYLLCAHLFHTASCTTQYCWESHNITLLELHSPLKVLFSSCTNFLKELTQPLQSQPEKTTNREPSFSPINVENVGCGSTSETWTGNTITGGSEWKC